MCLQARTATPEGYSRSMIHNETRVIEQSIQVPYTYPVLFTRDVFDPGNEVLADVCIRDGAARIRKVLVVIDAGVAQAYPGLTRAIEAWFAGRTDTLALTRSPMLVPGGEAIKNDP